MAGKGKPDWLMLVLGLVLGLFVAFVVYLSSSSGDAPSSGVGKKPLPANGQSGARRPVGGDVTAPTQRPRFEFYSILPELEVVVPEKDALEDIRVDQPAATAKPVEPAGAEAAVAKLPDERASSTSYYLQTGSFKSSTDADRRKVSLLLMGLDVNVRPVSINGQQWHRVYAGPFRDRAALDDALGRLRAQAIDYMIVRARQ